jgi:hypothetical protein
MKNIAIYAILGLFIASSVAAQSGAVVVVQQDGSELLTNDQSSLPATTAIRLKKTGFAEGYVFPHEAPRQKKYVPAQKIFTGVFSGRKVEKKDEDGKEKARDFFAGDSASADTKADDKEADSSTLAWLKKEGLYFHSPFLECGSFTRRIWIKELAPLAGIDPCPKCFRGTGQAPAFIRKECGGLDLAKADELLDNAAFIEWLGEHLPVKKAIFLTGKKLLVYPKQEMSDKALQELAHEVAMAHRRHTWRVIEVMAKNSEEDLESQSSF